MTFAGSEDALTALERKIAQRRLLLRGYGFSSGKYCKFSCVACVCRTSACRCTDLAG